MKLLITFFISALTLSADIENGKNVYLQNCANCHGIDMKGGLGKDFNLVSYNRKKADIIRYISAPSSMFKEFGYTSNAMPTIPLKGKQIEDVSEYIDSLQPFKSWMKK